MNAVQTYMHAYVKLCMYVNTTDITNEDVEFNLLDVKRTRYKSLGNDKKNEESIIRSRRIKMPPSSISQG